MVTPQDIERLVEALKELQKSKTATSAARETAGKWMREIHSARLAQQQSASSANPGAAWDLMDYRFGHPQIIPGKTAEVIGASGFPSPDRGPSILNPRPTVLSPQTQDMINKKLIYREKLEESYAGYVRRGDKAGAALFKQRIDAVDESIYRLGAERWVNGVPEGWLNTNAGYERRILADEAAFGSYYSGISRDFSQAVGMPGPAALTKLKKGEQIWTQAYYHSVPETGKAEEDLVRYFLSRPDKRAAWEQSLTPGQVEWVKQRGGLDAIQERVKTRLANDIFNAGESLPPLTSLGRWKQDASLDDFAFVDRMGGFDALKQLAASNPYDPKFYPYMNIGQIRNLDINALSRYSPLDPQYYQSYQVSTAGFATDVIPSQSDKIAQKLWIQDRTGRVQLTTFAEDNPLDIQLGVPYRFENVFAQPFLNKQNLLDWNINVNPEKGSRILPYPPESLKPMPQVQSDIDFTQPIIVDSISGKTTYTTKTGEKIIIQKGKAGIGAEPGQMSAIVPMPSGTLFEQTTGLNQSNTSLAFFKDIPMEQYAPQVPDISQQFPGIRGFVEAVNQGFSMPGVGGPMAIKGSFSLLGLAKEASAAQGVDDISQTKSRIRDLLKEVNEREAVAEAQQTKEISVDDYMTELDARGSQKTVGEGNDGGGFPWLKLAGGLGIAGGLSGLVAFVTLGGSWKPGDSTGDGGSGSSAKPSQSELDRFYAATATRSNFTERYNIWERDQGKSVISGETKNLQTHELKGVLEGGNLTASNQVTITSEENLEQARAQVYRKNLEERQFIQNKRWNEIAQGFTADTAAIENIQLDSLGKSVNDAQKEQLLYNKKRSMNVKLYNMELSKLRNRILVLEKFRRGELARGTPTDLTNAKNTQAILDRYHRQFEILKQQRDTERGKRLNLPDQITELEQFHPADIGNYDTLSVRPGQGPELAESDKIKGLVDDKQLLADYSVAVNELAVVGLSKSAPETTRAQVRLPNDPIYLEMRQIIQEEIDAYFSEGVATD
jgi:hypothetical protein